MKKQLSTLVAIALSCAMAAAPLAAEAKGAKKAKPHASKSAKGKAAPASNFGKPQK